MNNEDFEIYFQKEEQKGKKNPKNKTHCFCCQIAFGNVKKEGKKPPLRLKGQKGFPKTS